MVVGSIKRQLSSGKTQRVVFLVFLFLCGGSAAGTGDIYSL